MTSAVEAAIDAAHASGRGALIAYLPLGYPDRRSAVNAAVTAAANGADIIELGVPYSDPVMDGPIIQEATQVALAGGFRVADVFPAVTEVVERGGKPVLVMTYWNPVLQYGVERFADDLRAAGGSGLITPDITPDSAEEWIAAAERTGLDRVFLAAPTSTDDRLAAVAAASSGFVYTVSTMGTTGERAHLDAAARTVVDRLRRHGVRRACVGIGISTAEQVAEVLEYADGAIVGTALVRALRDGGAKGLAAMTRSLAAGARP